MRVSSVASGVWATAALTSLLLGACDGGDGEDCSTNRALCTEPCTDEDDCETGLSCGLVVESATDDIITVCVPAGSGNRPAGATCNTDDDCESTLCHEWLCREICDACESGETCSPVTLAVDGRDVDTSVCRWFFPPPDLELGAVDTPLAGSEEISFDVSPGVIAFVITVIDEEGLRVGFRSLIAPDGTVLVDMDDGMTDLNRAPHNPGTASMMVPNTNDPMAAVQPGTYALRLGTFEVDFAEPPIPEAGDVERVVVVFELSGEQGGLLDLNFFFAPGSGITADEAPSSMFVTSMLARAGTMLSNRANIRFGEVTFVGDVSDEHDTVDALDELFTICSVYSEPGPNGGALNVVLIDDITFTAGAAGGLPAPPGIYGTPASCLVVERYGSGLDTGILLAHELSHMLGLFHTTEAFDANIHDPISDTPECSPGTMVVDCPDYMNLMFPYFPLSTSLAMSPGQVSILRLNPQLYELGRSAACPTAGTTYDVTGWGFATGDSAALSDDFEGTCGGQGAAERVQLYRLNTPGLSALEIRATGIDFAPAVHVRSGDCSDAGAELACDSGDAGTEVVISVATPEPDAYFVFVDGRDGAGGTFVLEVEEIP